MKKIETILKQLLLRVLLMFGNSQTSKNTRFIPAEFPHVKILIIRLNRIGDALVTTPLIKEIATNIDCQIEILADRKNHFIFENNPFVDKVVIFKKGLRAIWGIKKYINNSNFDVIVDTHDDVSTTVSFIVAMSKVQFKFGLKKSNEMIFTNTVERLNGKKHHVVDRILKLSELFGIASYSQDTNIIYSPKETSNQFAKNFITDQFKERKFTIGINISAGSSARFWGIKRFKKLLNYLSNMNLNIVLISPPKDLNLAESITDGKYAIFSESDFDKAACIVSKLDLLFTPDTSLVHIASAFKVPVFGLYVKYNTDDTIWFPYKSKYETVITKEANFDNLNFETVSEKFIPFLNSLSKEYKQAAL